jgi:hypothetical protein
MKWGKVTSWNVISNLKDLRDLAQKIVLISKDLQLTFQVVSLTNPELKERGHHEMEEVESPFCGIGVRPRCSCDLIACSASAESLREPAGKDVPG